MLFVISPPKYIKGRNLLSLYLTRPNNINIEVVMFFKSFPLKYEWGKDLSLAYVT